MSDPLNFDPISRHRINDPPIADTEGPEPLLCMSEGFSKIHRGRCKTTLDRLLDAFQKRGVQFWDIFAKTVRMVDDLKGQSRSLPFSKTLHGTAPETA